MSVCGSLELQYEVNSTKYEKKNILLNQKKCCVAGAGLFCPMMNTFNIQRKSQTPRKKGVKN